MNLLNCGPSEVNVLQRTELSICEYGEKNIMSRDTHVLIAQIQELLELDTTVRESTEGSLFLELGGDGGIGNTGVSLH